MVLEIMDMLDTTTDLMDMDTHTGDRYQFKINCLNCQDLSDSSNLTVASLYRASF